MRLEFHFNNMPRSEHLEMYVSDRLEPMITHVLRRDDCHVMVWLMASLSRRQRGTPEFRCEIEVRYPPRRDFFVAKSATEMHIAITDAIDALKNHLSEDSKREIDLRRGSAHGRRVLGI